MGISRKTKEARRAKLLKQWYDDQYRLDGTGVTPVTTPMYGHNGEMYIVSENIDYVEPRTASVSVHTITMHNERGEEVPAIPLPLFGLKKRCSCGKSFWRTKNYSAHYALEHIVLGTQPL